MTRFTLRELILLTALVAVWAAWAGDRARIAEQQAAADAQYKWLAEEIQRRTGMQGFWGPW